MGDQQAALVYPRGVSVNFRKLDRIALTRILRHYGVEPKKEVGQAELAKMVASIFEVSIVLENEVLDRISASFCHSGADPEASFQNPKKRSSSIRELLDGQPALSGEQIAAKVPEKAHEEGGGWILGNVLSFDYRNQVYEVQDEDDMSRVMLLAYHDVKRLEDTSSHLRRGDAVLAVFPETTSFYRAVVAKNPKPPSAGSGNWEVIVKFEDDEDESGKSPARRIPARFVLRRCDVEQDFENESEDDD